MHLCDPYSGIPQLSSNRCIDIHSLHHCTGIHSRVKVKSSHHRRIRVQGWRSRNFGICLNGEDDLCVLGRRLLGLSFLEGWLFAGRNGRRRSLLFPVVSVLVVLILEATMLMLVAPGFAVVCMLLGLTG